MKNSDVYSQLVPTSRNQGSKWSYVIIGLFAFLLVAAIFPSQTPTSLLEESIGAKENDGSGPKGACQEQVDCKGCSRVTKFSRRRLPVTPGNAPDCKNCCAAFAAILKGNSVLQIVPRGQAQQAAAGPPIQYSQLQYRPSPTDPQQFPLNIGASVTPSEQGSLYGGTEMPALMRGRSSAQAGPSGVMSPPTMFSPSPGAMSPGRGTPGMVLTPGAVTPTRKSPSLSAMSIKIPISEEQKLPPMMLDDGAETMDVFLVRHGESTANEIKEMAKAGEVIEVAYKRKIFAKDLYNGCNQTPLPYGVYPLDCTELLQDARLTEKGINDAIALYERWNDWAVASSRPIAYNPEDAAVIVSPLRRSAVTGLMPFKDVLDKIHVEVEFDFRELQYTLRSGLFAENQCMDYPRSLQNYVNEIGLNGPTFHYHAERLEREGHGPGGKFVQEIWESDEEHPLAPGCPKNTEHFQGAIQRAVEYARKYGRKFVVIGTHSYVIKCTNREFSLSRTKGKPDAFDPYYKMGGYLLENGAVERIVWNFKDKHVVGPPKMVWKGLSKEKYFNRHYWPTPPASPGRSPEASPVMGQPAGGQTAKGPTATRED